MSFRHALSAMLVLFLFCEMPFLFASSVTNEGKAQVKLSRKTKRGFPNEFTLPPKETLNLPRDVMLVTHIPDKSIEKIKVVIKEDNGKEGSIEKSGGSYEFGISPEVAKAAEKKKGGPPPLKPGLAANKSDVEFNFIIIGSNGLARTHHLMPGQTVVIPEDTVEVTAEKAYVSPLPAKYNVLVTMPDGKKHEIKTARETIRLDDKEKK